MIVLSTLVQKSVWHKFPEFIILYKKHSNGFRLIPVVLD